MTTTTVPTISDVCAQAFPAVTFQAYLRGEITPETLGEAMAVRRNQIKDCLQENPLLDNLDQKVSALRLMAEHAMLAMPGVFHRPGRKPTASLPIWQIDQEVEQEEMYPVTPKILTEVYGPVPKSLLWEPVGASNKPITAKKSWELAGQVGRQLAKDLQAAGWSSARSSNPTWETEPLFIATLKVKIKQ